MKLHDPPSSRRALTPIARSASNSRLAGGVIGQRANVNGYNSGGDYNADGSNYDLPNTLASGAKLHGANKKQ